MVQGQNYYLGCYYILWKANYISLGVHFLLHVIYGCPLLSVELRYDHVHTFYAKPLIYINLVLSMRYPSYKDIPHTFNETFSLFNRGLSFLDDTTIIDVILYNRQRDKSVTLTTFPTCIGVEL